LASGYGIGQCWSNKSAINVIIILVFFNVLKECVRKCVRKCVRQSALLCVFVCVKGRALLCCHHLKWKAFIVVNKSKMFENRGARCLGTEASAVIDSSFGK